MTDTQTDGNGALATSDFERFRGLLPYDAQYVGTFQPLLGWRGKTTRDWITNQVGRVYDALRKRIESDRLKTRGTAFAGGLADPGPVLIHDGAFRWLRSAMTYDGGDTLKSLLNTLSDSEGNVEPKLDQVIDLLKLEVINSALSEYLGGLNSGETESTANANEANEAATVPAILHARADFEAVSDFLIGLRNRSAAQLTAYLKAAFTSRSHDYERALWWCALLQGEQPDGEKPAESSEEGFRLSPIGLLNLYRHYYYDFGNYLGPPVEHIWVAPYSKTELVEVWSQTSYRFRESEETLQIMQAEETAVKEATELSEEVQRKREQDFKTGVTSEFGYNILVAQGSGSFSMEYGSHLSNDKKTARKESREQSSKTASEMKKSVRLLTRESVETRTENSRRHTIENPSEKPVSFEMRRKMRKVGIQMQHVGTQLCWQLIVDEPGHNLGLAELVHIAKPEDFNATPAPNISPPSFQTLTEDYQFRIPFQPTTANYVDDGDYSEGTLESPFGVLKIKSKFRFNAPAPQPGYELTSVVEKAIERTDAEEDPPSLWAVNYVVTKADAGEFEARLRDVNFEEQPAVLVTVSLNWQVKDDVRANAETEYRGKMAEYEQEKQQQAQLAMVEGLRDRVNLARSIVPRSSTDLREEERTILYRRAIGRLLPPEVTGHALHGAAELVRTYFDTDKLLYFVAPDWWKPKHVRKVPTKAPRQAPHDIVGIANESAFGDPISAPGYRGSHGCYTWYRDGTVTSGTPTNLGASGSAQTYSLPPGKIPDDIVGIGRGSNFYIAWYIDGTMSAGYSPNNLTRDFGRYKLALDKTPDDIVGIAMSPGSSQGGVSGDRCYAYYRDGTVSTGYYEALTSEVPTEDYSLPPGKSPNDIVAVAARAVLPGAKAHDHFYTWYRDGTMSEGSLLDLGASRPPYPYVWPGAEAEAEPEDVEPGGQLERIRFEKEQEPRPNNYLITEDSEPAPLGSSIGWITQLDGDSHRNAFLNAAWAKVVIPIRRGREEAAINWLKDQNIEDREGLGSWVLDANGDKIPKLDDQEPPKVIPNEFVTIEDKIDDLVAALQETQTEDAVYLAAQSVYETGFEPLGDSFGPGSEPFEVFAQWVELVPTNQIVPVQYEVT